MQVKLRRNESSENLIKRFSRKMKNSDIIDEVLERQYYKKPSVKKREQHFRRLRTIEKAKRKEAELEERNSK